MKRPSRPFSPTRTSKQPSSPPSLSRPRRTRTERWERDLLPSDRDESTADPSSDNASQPKYEWDMKDFPDLCAAVQSVMEAAEAELTHMLSESNPSTSTRDTATRPPAPFQSCSPSSADIHTPPSPATTPQSSKPEIDTKPDIEQEADSYTHKSAFLGEAPPTSSSNNLAGTVVVYFPLSRSEEGHIPQASHAVARAKQGLSGDDSPQHGLPPPRSYSVATILSSDSDSETGLQAQHAGLHATLLQTRASFASSPHVLDPDTELQKFNDKYEAPEGDTTQLEAALHRMHAEISFMWSIIRKGRHAGRRTSGEQASNGGSEESNDSKGSDAQEASDGSGAEAVAASTTE